MAWDKSARGAIETLIKHVGSEDDAAVDECHDAIDVLMRELDAHEERMADIREAVRKATILIGGRAIDKAIDG